MFVTRLSMCVRFLFLHTLCTTFRNLPHSILLSLIGLSIHILYAAFFFSNALRHSSSNHPLLSGFGWYIFVCSAASIITSLIVSSLHVHGFPPLHFQVLTFQIPLPVAAGTTQPCSLLKSIYMEPSCRSIRFIFTVYSFASISASKRKAVTIAACSSTQFHV